MKNFMKKLRKHTGSEDQSLYTRSYAQWGEDVLILRLFKLIPSDKTFLDVGAHHPYEISNTALLSEHGWKGINVEPNPILFRRFEELRPKDVNVCAGIAGKGGVKLPFYMIDDWSGRNSFDREMVEYHVTYENPSVKIQKVIDVDVITLEECINRYARGKFPDYFSIDVENLEYEIISSYDLRENGPKVLTMEVSSKKEEMMEYMDKMGYFLWIKIASNYTWVRKEYRERIMK